MKIYAVKNESGYIHEQHGMYSSLHPMMMYMNREVATSYATRVNGQIETYRVERIEIENLKEVLEEQFKSKTLDPFDNVLDRATGLDIEYDGEKVVLDLVGEGGVVGRYSESELPIVVEWAKETGLYKETYQRYEIRIERLREKARKDLLE